MVFMRQPEMHNVDLGDGFSRIDPTFNVPYNKETGDDDGNKFSARN